MKRNKIGIFLVFRYYKRILKMRTSRIAFYLTTILVVFINFFNNSNQMVIDRKDAVKLNKRQYYRPPSVPNIII